MKPYNKEYILKTIEEYNRVIKDGVKGEYKINRRRFNKKELHGYMYKNIDEYEIDILELTKDEKCVMRLDPREIESSYEAINYSYGKVGIVGLGLGYVIEEMAKKPEVEEIVVYEISQEVIDLYYNNFPENPKIKVVCCNAFEAESRKFDFFYADIYEYKITSQIVEDYKRFNELHEIEEYSFFGMEHFLLSCSYTEIVWVYIPENWMESSRKAFESIQESNLLDYYEKLDDNLISQVLEEFKTILNDI